MSEVPPWVETLAERWLIMATNLRQPRDDWGLYLGPRTSLMNADKADAYDQCACELREMAQGKRPVAPARW